MKTQQAFYSQLRKGVVLKEGLCRNLHHVRALSLWFSLDLCRFLHCCLDREV